MTEPGAGRDLLGHSTMRVTEEHYEHRLPEDALRGMKLLEAKAAVEKYSKRSVRWRIDTHGRDVLNSKNAYSVSHQSLLGMRQTPPSTRPVSAR